MSASQANSLKRKALAPLATNSQADDIEAQRQARMAANAAKMAQLGLETFGAAVTQPKKKACAAPKPKAPMDTLEPERRSARASAALSSVA